MATKAELEAKVAELEKMLDKKVLNTSFQNKSIESDHVANINAALDYADKNQHKKSYNCVSAGLRKALKYI